jgi:flagellin
MLAHTQLIVDAPGVLRDPVRPSDAALRAQFREVGEAQRAAQDGVSLAQTAEPTLTEVHALLQLARDRPGAAGDDATTGAPSTAIAEDLAELAAELAGIARTAGRRTALLDATASSPSSDGPGADGPDAIARTLVDVATAVTAAAAPTGPPDVAVERAVAAVAGARASVRAARDRLLDRMDTLAVRQAGMAALAEQRRAG